jgi:tetratricopeptide (TPR) repeat protein
MKISRLVTVRHLLLPLAAVLAIALAPSAASAQQQPTPEVEREEPNVLMGERAFRRFEDLTELYSASKYQEALKAVQEYLNGQLNDYERAMGEQIYGFVLIALDRVDDAIKRFERAVELDALPNKAHFSMMKSLAQLYASREEWQRSINMMEQYLKFQPEPTPDDRIMMGQNYAQMERYREALPWVTGALQQAGADAKESWYQLALAIHFELKDYRSAVALLKSMVARWPDKLRYWEMLSGAHQELNQDVDALAAMMAAYHGGLITEQAKLLTVARMSMFNDMPFQGAQILTKGMEAGQIEASEANLRLLLGAWTSAREYARAGAVIDRLAPMTGEGDLLMQKARLMMEQNEWQETVDAARAALDLGNVKNPGGAWLMIGIATMELGQLRESRNAFQRAQEFDADTRRQAREWQRFVEDRIQLAELRARN